MITFAAMCLKFKGFFKRKKKPEPPPLPAAKPKPPPPPPPVPQPRLPRIHAIQTKNLEWLPSPNFKPRPGPRSLRMIVIHATEAPWNSAVDWLRKGDRLNRSSAHYVIGKDGRVAQLVREDDVAWHAIGINGWSIGIELETNDAKDCHYTQAQLDFTMGIVLRACLKHGIHPSSVVAHADVDPKRKTDPIQFPWPEFRFSLAYHIDAASAEVNT